MADETQTQQTQTQEPAGAQPPAQGAPPAGVQPRNPVPASALPESALIERIARAKRQGSEEARTALLAELGIDDPAKFRADQQRRAEEEERRRAQREQEERAKLSEAERYKADLAARERERDEARREADEARREASNAKIGATARSAAAPHIADEMYEYAEGALKKHIAGLTEHARKRFDAEDAAEFFKDLAKKNPRFARSAAKPTPIAPPRKPLTTGTSPQRTTTPPGTAQRPIDASAAKTAAPGKANSMTLEEVQALTEKQFGFVYKPYGGGDRGPSRSNGATKPEPALGSSPSAPRR